MDLKPLERGQLGVMLVSSLLVAVPPLVGAAVLLTALRDKTGLAPGPLIAALALLLAYPVLVGPFRRYRTWGYALGEHELHVRHGVWTEIDTTVPLRRVQHLDVAQGPLERLFGVTRLVLHTAGTANSEVVLPGLTRATAEAYRDDIRAHIRQEPE